MNSRIHEVGGVPSSVGPFGIGVALTGPTGQPIRRAEASVFPSFFSQLKRLIIFWFKFSLPHYGLKYFPLLNPSQIAPKFNSLVEQCRTKIQIQLEAGHGWEGFHVKICLQKSVETE